MSDAIAHLEKRMLGRSGARVAPLLWELESPPDAAIAKAVIDAGADWFLIPSSVSIDAIEPLVEPIAGMSNPRIVVGATAEELITRTRRAEVQRIDAIAPLRCDAVMVQSAELSQMKSGGPFHRTGNLRQQGKCEFVFAEASSVQDAQWIILNSPAYAVSVPFGIADQSAAFEVLALGEEMGTAILARSPDHAVWETETPTRQRDIAFALSHRPVVMATAPFPRSMDQALAIMSAAGRPMDSSEREQLWRGFCAQVPAPQKLRSGHSPEQD